MRIRSSIRRLERMAFLVAVMMCFGVPTPTVLAYEECEEICDEEQDCAEPCEVNTGQGILLTECGEYDGGAENGWCAGNTCDSLCWEEAECDWECYDDGMTICGLYEGGESGGMCELTCGDGICSVSNGEPDSSSGNHCPSDCGQDMCPTQGPLDCNPSAPWFGCPSGERCMNNCQCEEPTTPAPGGCPGQICGDAGMCCGPTEDCIHDEDQDEFYCLPRIT